MPHGLLTLLNPLQPLCDDWCLHFWEVIGVWFTGLATFAAVVTSLLLAGREGIRIQVSAGHRLMVGTGTEPPFPEFLAISVKNVGSRRATIDGVGWRRRPWQRLHGVQQFDPESGYMGPPVTIEPGSAHTFLLPLSNTRMQWGEDFLKDFVGRWPPLGVHLIRVIAWTPAGDRCSRFLEPSLKQWLIKKAKN